MKTYTHNGHTSEILYADKSDMEMAGMVRMVTRDQLDHEPIVQGARDRILHLSQRNAALEANLRELNRLYNWRFELAIEEKAEQTTAVKSGREWSGKSDALKAKLRQYGEEKKMAWAETYRLLSE